MIPLRKKYDIVIAIDPDVDKSGVAVLKVASAEIKLYNMYFPELLDFLKEEKERGITGGENKVVIVEEGFFTEAHWHISPKDNPYIAAAKGNSVGRNHEVGRKIIEMCLHYKMNVKGVRPLIKCWAGKDRKITDKELKSFTNVEGRTNQDMRDAALMAWVYAGLPIRIPVLK